ncbi:MAG: DUF3598 domain-containing protein [Gammaproteobacteria bacterium]|nr:DUF3598 domain-containing protein [Gammaproteobacteria bacterium]
MTENIRTGMPVLARHEGEWVGEYIHIDPDGTVQDRHASHLSCTFPAAGPHDYFQTNTYTWADGKREQIEFPAVYRDGRIWWDNERIAGSAWEVDERTMMLNWIRKDMPGSYLYEMIQINSGNDLRGRTWHWFVDDELIRRTCIKERRTA